MAIDKFNFDYTKISVCRTQLMGCATVMILLCHANGYGVVLPSSLRGLLIYGNLGVDIFLFLSGFGCYYSLSKTKRIMWFYKRRMFRILLPYIIVNIFFLIVDVILQEDISIGQWLFELSTLSFWLQHKGAWFVALIIPVYLISPFIYKLLQFTSRKLVVCIILIIGVLMLTSHAAYPTTGSQFALIDNLQWAFSRSISFIVGMYFASLAMKRQSANVFVIISINVAIFIFLRLVIPSWFRNWCYVIPMIVILCYLFSIVNKYSFINKVGCWLGTISLESYLTNVGFKSRMQYILGNMKTFHVFQGHYLDYCLIVILGLLTAFYINRFVCKINNIISRQ